MSQVKIGSSVFLLPKCCLKDNHYQSAFTWIKVKLSLSFWVLPGFDISICLNSSIIQDIEPLRQECQGRISKEPGQWPGSCRETKSRWADSLLCCGLSRLTDGGRLFSPTPLEVCPVTWFHYFLVISWTRFLALFTRRTLGSITALLPTMPARPGVRSRRWKSVSYFLKRFPLKTGKWIEHFKFSIRPSV